MKFKEFKNIIDKIEKETENEDIDIEFLFTAEDSDFDAEHHELDLEGAGMFSFVKDVNIYFSSEEISYKLLIFDELLYLIHNLKYMNLNDELKDSLYKIYVRKNYKKVYKELKCENARLEKEANTNEQIK